MVGGEESEAVVRDDQVEVSLLLYCLDTTMVANHPAEKVWELAEKCPGLCVARAVAETEWSQFDKGQVGVAATEPIETLAITAQGDLCPPGEVVLNQRDTPCGMPQTPIERSDEY